MPPTVAGDDDAAHARTHPSSQPVVYAVQEALCDGSQFGREGASDVRAASDPDSGVCEACVGGLGEEVAFYFGCALHTYRRYRIPQMDGLERADYFFRMTAHN